MTAIAVRKDDTRAVGEDEFSMRGSPGFRDAFTTQRIVLSPFRLIFAEYNSIEIGGIVGHFTFLYTFKRGAIVRKRSGEIKSFGVYRGNKIGCVRASQNLVKWCISKAEFGFEVAIMQFGVSEGKVKNISGKS